MNKEQLEIRNLGNLQLRQEGDFGQLLAGRDRKSVV